MPYKDPEKKKKSDKDRYERKKEHILKEAKNIEILIKKNAIDIIKNG